MLKTEILKMLRESTGYLSGQQLCEKLSVSRTAIWKVIHQLEEEGYEIEAIRNKGYCLVGSPDILSKEELRSLSTTTWLGKEIVYMSETDSTNKQAKRLADTGAVHGTVVVADMQQAGKGRRGKTWISPGGTSIYLSMILRPELEPPQAPMLTLLMAYSVARVLRDKEELNVKIKWPNDIVLHKKKICGILTEMSTEIDYINHVVIGVGINVNGECVPEELQNTATSIRIEEGRAIKRAELITEILEHFEKNYEKFIACGSLAFIQKEYNALLINCDREVKVLEPKHEYTAYALGINETGELLVKTATGDIETIYAGEVSVRGIYGYV